MYRFFEPIFNDRKSADELGGWVFESGELHIRGSDNFCGVFSGYGPYFFRFNSKQQALYILDRPGSRGQLRAQM